MSTAGSLGLRVASVELESQEPEEYIQAIRQLPEADVVELKSFVTEPLARYLYASADGVLANSVHEPFGLVGLEAMAVGGVAYTGSTGEDYAIPMENAVVLETQDPEEIVGYALCLREQPELKRSISEGAKRTARHHTWEKVVGSLLSSLEYLSQRQGLPLPIANPCAPGCDCGDLAPILALKSEDQAYTPSTPGSDGLSLVPSLASSQGSLLMWRKRPLWGGPQDSPA